MKPSFRALIIDTMKAIAGFNIFAGVFIAICLIQESWVYSLGVIIGALICAVAWYAGAILVDAAHWYITQKEWETSDEQAEDN